mgnify:CR=1 FL=1
MAARHFLMGAAFFAGLFLAAGLAVAFFSAAAAAVMKTPLPVASLRPREPPKAMGFPVTTPGTVRPTFME